MRQALGSCLGRTWKETENGADATASLSELRLPATGDEQIAYRLSLTTFILTVSIDLVAVRAGSTIAVFGGVEVATIAGGGQLDPHELGDIVAKGVAKLPS